MLNSGASTRSFNLPRRHSTGDDVESVERGVCNTQVDTTIACLLVMGTSDSNGGDGQVRSRSRNRLSSDGGGRLACDTYRNGYASTNYNPHSTTASHEGSGNNLGSSRHSSGVLDILDSNLLHESHNRLNNLQGTSVASSHNQGSSTLVGQHRSSILTPSLCSSTTGETRHSLQTNGSSHSTDETGGLNGCTMVVNGYDNNVVCRHLCDTNTPMVMQHNRGRASSGRPNRTRSDNSSGSSRHAHTSGRMLGARATSTHRSFGTPGIVGNSISRSRSNVLRNTASIHGGGTGAKHLVYMQSLPWNGTWATGGSDLNHNTSTRSMGARHPSSSDSGRATNDSTVDTTRGSGSGHSEHNEDAHGCCLDRGTVATNGDDSSCSSLTISHGNDSGGAGVLNSRRDSGNSACTSSSNSGTRCTGCSSISRSSNGSGSGTDSPQYLSSSGGWISWPTGNTPSDRSRQDGVGNRSCRRRTRSNNDVGSMVVQNSLSGDDEAALHAKASACVPRSSSAGSKCVVLRRTRNSVQFGWAAAGAEGQEGGRLRTTGVPEGERLVVTSASGSNLSGGQARDRAVAALSGCLFTASTTDTSRAAFSTNHHDATHASAQHSSPGRRHDAVDAVAAPFTLGGIWPTVDDASSRPSRDPLLRTPRTEAETPAALETCETAAEAATVRLPVWEQSVQLQLAEAAAAYLKRAYGRGMFVGPPAAAERLPLTERGLVALYGCNTRTGTTFRRRASARADNVEEARFENRTGTPEGTITLPSGQHSTASEGTIIHPAVGEGPGRTVTSHGGQIRTQPVEQKQETCVCLPDAPPRSIQGCSTGPPSSAVVSRRTPDGDPNSAAARSRSEGATASRPGIPENESSLGCIEQQFLRHQRTSSHIQQQQTRVQQQQWQQQALPQHQRQQQQEDQLQPQADLHVQPRDNPPGLHDVAELETGLAIRLPSNALRASEGGYFPVEPSSQPPAITGERRHIQGNCTSCYTNASAGSHNSGSICSSSLCSIIDSATLRRILTRQSPEGPFMENNNYSSDSSGSHHAHVGNVNNNALSPNSTFSNNNVRERLSAGWPDLARHVQDSCTRLDTAQFVSETTAVAQEGGDALASQAGSNLSRPHYSPASSVDAGIISLALAAPLRGAGAVSTRSLHLGRSAPTLATPLSGIAVTDALPSTLNTDVDATSFSGASAASGRRPCAAVAAVASAPLDRTVPADSFLPSASFTAASTDATNPPAALALLRRAPPAALPRAALESLSPAVPAGLSTFSLPPTAAPANLCAATAGHPATAADVALAPAASTSVTPSTSHDAAATLPMPPLPAALTLPPPPAPSTASAGAALAAFPLITLIGAAAAPFQNVVPAAPSGATPATSSFPAESAAAAILAAAAAAPSAPGSASAAGGPTSTSEEVTTVNRPNNSTGSTSPRGAAPLRWLVAAVAMSYNTPTVTSEPLISTPSQQDGSTTVLHRLQAVTSRINSLEAAASGPPCADGCSAAAISHPAAAGLVSHCSFDGVTASPLTGCLRLEMPSQSHSSMAAATRALRPTCCPNHRHTYGGSYRNNVSNNINVAGGSINNCVSSSVSSSATPWIANVTANAANATSSGDNTANRHAGSTTETATNSQSSSSRNGSQNSGPGTARGEGNSIIDVQNRDTADTVACQASGESGAHVVGYTTELHAPTRGAAEALLVDRAAAEFVADHPLQRAPESAPCPAHDEPSQASALQTTALSTTARRPHTETMQTIPPARSIRLVEECGTSGAALSANPAPGHAAAAGGSGIEPPATESSLQYLAASPAAAAIRANGVHGAAASPTSRAVRAGNATLPVDASQANRALSVALPRSVLSTSSRETAAADRAAVGPEGGRGQATAAASTLAAPTTAARQPAGARTTTPSTAEREISAAYSAAMAPAELTPIGGTSYECPICLELYSHEELRRPKVLSCGHSLCFGCVLRLLPNQEGDLLLLLHQQRRYGSSSSSSAVSPSFSVSASSPSSSTTAPVSSCAYHATSSSSSTTSTPPIFLLSHPATSSSSMSPLSLTSSSSSASFRALSSSPVPPSSADGQGVERQPGGGREPTATAAAMVLTGDPARQQNSFSHRAQRNVVPGCNESRQQSSSTLINDHRTQLMRATLEEAASSSGPSGGERGGNCFLVGSGGSGALSPQPSRSNGAGNDSAVDILRGWSLISSESSGSGGLDSRGSSSGGSLSSNSSNNDSESTSRSDSSNSSNVQSHSSMVPASFSTGSSNGTDPLPQQEASRPSVRPTTSSTQRHGLRAGHFANMRLLQLRLQAIMEDEEDRLSGRRTAPYEPQTAGERARRRAARSERLLQLVASLNAAEAQQLYNYFKQKATTSIPFTCPWCRRRITVAAENLALLPSVTQEREYAQRRRTREEQEEQSTEEGPNTASAACESGAGDGRDRFLRGRTISASCSHAQQQSSRAKAHGNQVAESQRRPAQEGPDPSGQAAASSRRPLKSYCSQHADQEVIAVCEPCLQLVCGNCVATEDAPHYAHHPRLALGAALQQLEQRGNEAAAVLRRCAVETLQADIYNTNHNQRLVDDALRRATASAQARVEELRRVLDSHANRLYKRPMSVHGRRTTCGLHLQREMRDAINAAFAPRYGLLQQRNQALIALQQAALRASCLLSSQLRHNPQQQQQSISSSSSSRVNHACTQPSQLTQNRQQSRGSGTSSSANSAGIVPSQLAQNREQRSSPGTSSSAISGGVELSQLTQNRQQVSSSSSSNANTGGIPQQQTQSQQQTHPQQQTQPQHPHTGAIEGTFSSSLQQPVRTHVPADLPLRGQQVLKAGGATGSTRTDSESHVPAQEAQTDVRTSTAASSTTNTSSPSGDGRAEDRVRATSSGPRSEDCERRSSNSSTEEGGNRSSSSSNSGENSGGETNSRSNRRGVSDIGSSTCSSTTAGASGSNNNEVEGSRTCSTSADDGSSVTVSRDSSSACPHTSDRNNEIINTDGSRSNGEHPSNSTSTTHSRRTSARRRGHNISECGGNIDRNNSVTSVNTQYRGADSTATATGNEREVGQGRRDRRRRGRTDSLDIEGETRGTEWTEQRPRKRLSTATSPASAGAPDKSTNTSSSAGSIANAGSRRTRGRGQRTGSTSTDSNSSSSSISCSIASIESSNSTVNRSTTTVTNRSDHSNNRSTNTSSGLNTDSSTSSGSPNRAEAADGRSSGDGGNSSCVSSHNPNKQSDEGRRSVESIRMQTSNGMAASGVFGSSGSNVGGVFLSNGNADSCSAAARCTTDDVDCGTNNTNTSIRGGFVATTREFGNVRAGSKVNACSCSRANRSCNGSSNTATRCRPMRPEICPSHNIGNGTQQQGRRAEERGFETARTAPERGGETEASHSRNVRSQGDPSGYSGLPLSTPERVASATAAARLETLLPLLRMAQDAHNRVLRFRRTAAAIQQQEITEWPETVQHQLSRDLLQAPIIPTESMSSSRQRNNGRLGATVLSRYEVRPTSSSTREESASCETNDTSVSSGGNGSSCISQISHSHSCSSCSRASDSNIISSQSTNPAVSSVNSSLFRYSASESNSSSGAGRTGSGTRRTAGMEVSTFWAANRTLARLNAFRDMAPTVPVTDADTSQQQQRRCGTAELHMLAGSIRDEPYEHDRYRHLRLLFQRQYLRTQHPHAQRSSSALQLLALPRADATPQPDGQQPQLSEDEQQQRQRQEDQQQEQPCRFVCSDDGGHQRSRQHYTQEHHPQQLQHGQHGQISQDAAAQTDHQEQEVRVQQHSRQRQPPSQEQQHQQQQGPHGEPQPLIQPQLQEQMPFQQQQQPYPISGRQQGVNACSGVSQEEEHQLSLMQQRQQEERPVLNTINAAVLTTTNAMPTHLPLQGTLTQRQVEALVSRVSSEERQRQTAEPQQQTNEQEQQHTQQLPERWPQQDLVARQQQPQVDQEQQQQVVVEGQRHRGREHEQQVEQGPQLPQEALHHQQQQEKQPHQLSTQQQRGRRQQPSQKHHRNRRQESQQQQEQQQLGSQELGYPQQQPQQQGEEVQHQRQQHCDEWHLQPRPHPREHHEVERSEKGQPLGQAHSPIAVADLKSQRSTRTVETEPTDERSSCEVRRSVGGSTSYAFTNQSSNSTDSSPNSTCRCPSMSTSRDNDTSSNGEPLNTTDDGGGRSRESAACTVNGGHARCGPCTVVPQRQTTGNPHYREGDSVTAGSPRSSAIYTGRGNGECAASSSALGDAASTASPPALAASEGSGAVQTLAAAALRHSPARAAGVGGSGRDVAPVPLPPGQASAVTSRAVHQCPRVAREATGTHAAVNAPAAAEFSASVATAPVSTRTSNAAGAQGIIAAADSHNTVSVDGAPATMEPSSIISTYADVDASCATPSPPRARASAVAAAAVVTSSSVSTALKPTQKPPSTSESASSSAANEVHAEDTSTSGAEGPFPYTIYAGDICNRSIPRTPRNHLSCPLSPLGSERLQGDVCEHRPEGVCLTDNPRGCGDALPSSPSTTASLSPQLQQQERNPILPQDPLQAGIQRDNEQQHLDGPTALQRGGTQITLVAAEQQGNQQHEWLVQGQQGRPRESRGEQHQLHEGGTEVAQAEGGQRRTTARGPIEQLHRGLSNEADVQARGF